MICEFKETLHCISRAFFLLKKRKSPPTRAAQHAGHPWRHVRAQKEEHSLLRNIDYQSMICEFKEKQHALELIFQVL